MTREQYENWKRERALTIKRRRRKITTIVVALMLVVGATIGTTVAWLTDSSETVTDTFTYGKVDIELWEGSTNTKWSKSDTVAAVTVANRYNQKIVPGAAITYNPYLEVVADSEDSYLFVEIENTNTDCFALELFGNWTLVPNQTNVYYYNTTYTNGSRLQIILSDVVTVKNTVTMKMINEWSAQNGIQPTITITAYAIQKDYLTDTNNDGKVDAQDAWKLLQDQIDSQS